MELFFALDPSFFCSFPFSKPTFGKTKSGEKICGFDLMILMVVFGPFNSLDIQSECAFPILAQEFRVKSDASGKETLLPTTQFRNKPGIGSSGYPALYGSPADSTVARLR